MRLRNPLRRRGGTACRDPGKPVLVVVGGPDVDARQDLMQSLARDFQVTAAGTEEGLYAAFAARGLPYHHYRMSRGVNPAADLAAVLQLVRIFRELRPAVVHTFDTKPGVWGRLAARLAGVPVIVGTLPGLGSLYGTRSRRATLLRLVYQPLQTLACRLADVTIFQNPDDAREFERRRVVPRGTSRVISGSGIRTDVFAPGADGAEPASRAELALPESGLVAVMISRVLRSKGVLEFAAAAAAAREAEPCLSFLLVGSADSESLDSLSASELDELSHSVSWNGPRSDVRRILALADIFVFPSYYREGIPRVLLEAASMAVPLVAADVPGSREVVEHEVNGLLVPPRDAGALAAAVLRLAASPDMRRRLGEQARRTALSRFDLSVVADETAALYRELLEAKRVA